MQFQIKSSFHKCIFTISLGKSNFSLSIDTGDKLVAYTSGDVIMLKTLKLLSVVEFEASLDEAQKWAKSVGYDEDDVNDIVKSVRKKKRG